MYSIWKEKYANPGWIYNVVEFTCKEFKGFNAWDSRHVGDAFALKK